MKKIKSFKLFESTQIVGWPDDKYPLLKQVIDDMITEFDDEFNGLNLEVHFYDSGGVRVEINVVPIYKNWEPVLNARYTTDEDGYDYYDFEYLSIKIKRFFENILKGYNCFEYQFATNYHLYSSGDEILNLVIFPDDRIKESSLNKTESQIMEDIFIPIEDDWGHMFDFKLYSSFGRMLIILKSNYVKSVNNGDSVAYRGSLAYEKIKNEVNNLFTELENELLKYKIKFYLDKNHNNYRLFGVSLPVITCHYNHEYNKNIVSSVNEGSKEELEILKDLFIPIEDDYGHMIRFDFYGFDHRSFYGSGVKMYLKDSYIKSINNGDHYASKKEKKTSDAYDRLRKELGQFSVYLEEELSKYKFGVKIDPLYYGYDFFMAELPVISLSLKENIIKENIIWQIPSIDKVDEVIEDALVEIEDEWGDKIDIIVDKVWGSRDRVISIFFRYETINSYGCGDEIYADGCINDTIAYKKLEEIMKSIIFDVKRSFGIYDKSFSIIYELPHLFYLSSSTSIIDIKIREI